VGHDTQGIAERYAAIDGLRIRYLERGSGFPLVMLHGGSLGSSADVFRRNFDPLVSAGYRVISFDQPGFGMSDNPADLGNSFRRRFVLSFLDTLRLANVALIAHSQAGGMAVSLALEYPGRFAAIIILGTGSLLPPLESGAGQREASAQQRLERRMGAAGEPSIDDTRRLLEANLYHHHLITDQELRLRHSMSIGKNFEAFLARSQLPDGKNKDRKGPPLWQKLPQVSMPLLMIYGRDDRGQAARRAEILLREYPRLNLHIVPNCKHLVPWDAAEEVHRLCIPFLTNIQLEERV
jgi:pimeloyl-ACP methyl ester carboxylesterase